MIRVCAEGELIVPQTIFSNDELAEFIPHIRVVALQYIEIICGCTTTRNEDFLGVLRIADDGSIIAICYCDKNCYQVFNSPVEFAKHGSRAPSVWNWRSKVWVLNCNDEKIKLSKTCLLKYYRGDEYRRPYNEVGHRDQFLNCSACNKLRRFEVRTKEACRLYHDALARANRTCYDMIPGRWTCNDLEERKSSKTRTGCRKDLWCEGCVHCVCFGCNMCRFEDCGCRNCVDYYGNAPN